MAKFRKEGGKETPAISTASLPDIVFMLLFFFMVSTTMREVLVMVDNGMPEAKEISKLEKNLWLVISSSENRKTSTWLLTEVNLVFS